MPTKGKMPWEHANGPVNLVYQRAEQKLKKGKKRRQKGPAREKEASLNYLSFSSIM